MTAQHPRTRSSQRNPGGRPRAFRGALGYLADKLGGEEPLAEELGSSPRSVRRWAMGQGKPNKASAKLLQKLAEKHGLTPREIQPILDGRGSI